MKTTNTIILLVVALAVLGAVIYTKQQEKQTFQSAAIPEKSIPAITSGTLVRIVIDAPDQEQVILTNKDDKWYTNPEQQHEADTNAVNSALQVLEEPVKATVVSTNPDSFSEYQVSDTSGTKVQVYQKGKAEPALSMIVGKDGPSAFSTYVRLGDAKEVLNAKASLSMAFKRPDGWRDKQIFNFSGPTATRIEETGTSATFTVVRTEDDKWMFEGEPGGEAESARVNSLANMLASLRANEFINPAQSQTTADFGLEPARQTIALTYEDKSTSPSQLTSATLLIGNESNTPGDWYAKRADKNDIFTIGSHVAESLSPDAESIKVAPPPAPEAENMEPATTDDSPTTGTVLESLVPDAETTATGGQTTDSTSVAIEPEQAAATPEATPPPAESDITGTATNQDSQTTATN